MYRTFLSLRLLLSRPINLIGILALFIAVGALIMILSIMTGFLDESRRGIRGSLSDVIIIPQHLGRSDRREVPLDPQRLLKVVRADPRVEAASAHLVWYGFVLGETGISREYLKHSRRGEDAIAQLAGIDVDEEFQATEFRQALEREPGDHGQPVVDSADPFALPPEYLPDGLPKASVVIGEQMMRRLYLRRGDVITIATAMPDADSVELGFTQNNRKFVIAGSFRTGENDMDLDRIYMDRRELSDLLGGTLEYSEVLVRLRDYDRDAGEVLEDLRYGLSALGLIRGFAADEVRTWEDFRGPLLGAIENERVLMGFMLSLVLVVAGFTVFAILSMMVTEKTRDIGILTAVGATPRGVMSLFLLIGFWDALLGATSGAVMGAWAAIEIDAIEQWLSRTIGIQIFNRDVYLFDHIPSRVEPLAVVAIVAGAFVCTLFFAALPAWRAARTDPIAALRYE